MIQRGEFILSMSELVSHLKSMKLLSLIAYLTLLSFKRNYLKNERINRKRFGNSLQQSPTTCRGLTLSTRYKWIVYFIHNCNSVYYAANISYIFADFPIV